MALQMPSGYGERALMDECAGVAQAVEGERNHALNRAAFKLAQLVGGGLLGETRVRTELCAAAARAGLENREIEKTISSGFRAGLLEPRVPAQRPPMPPRLPSSTGETCDTGSTPWSMELERARADLAAVGVGHAGFGADGDSPRPFFSPAAELFSRTFPSTPWQVRGLLTDRAVFAVAGEPKTAKTWAALEIAMALGTGTRAFGELEAVGGPRAVALFMVEDDAQSTRNRLRALAASRGLAPEAACARLHVENLAALDVRNPEHLARLVASVRAIPEPVAAVVLDPLRDVHTAEENSSTEMAEVMRALRALRTVLGCAVVFIHHSHKSGAEGKGRRPGQRMRGSSAIHGAVDGGLYLLDLTGNLETEWVMKAQAEVKRARSAGFFSLTLTVEDDANGEAVAAGWAFDRSGAGARDRPVETAAERIEAVAGVLRAADRPLGVREIERRLNVRHGDVTAPLKDLERDGNAKHTRRGWVWVSAEAGARSPSPSLYRDGDRDQSAERSPGPLGTDGDGGEAGEWMGGAT